MAAKTVSCSRGASRSGGRYPKKFSLVSQFASDIAELG
jgi:hypothetical protein